MLLETLRRDRLIAALPDGRGLATHTACTSTIFAMRSWSATLCRSVMNSILFCGLRGSGFVARVGHEVEETSTLVSLFSAGLGVAIVAEPTAALDIVGVCYRPLTPDALAVDLAAARAKQATHRRSRGCSRFCGMSRGRTPHDEATASRPPPSAAVTCDNHRGHQQADCITSVSVGSVSGPPSFSLVKGPYRGARRVSCTRSRRRCLERLEDRLVANCSG